MSGKIMGIWVYYHVNFYFVLLFTVNVQVVSHYYGNKDQLIFQHQDTNYPYKR